ncbi:UNVERIFIED_CONTAM: EP1-like glycoprotein 4 [Sesamum radiatum]|uniref:EP1-like glycoprotein 4 n=1 Tax=Sesamum radiatum TaxID=300843 RepID=A0AAW2T750_SESRA
MSISCFVTRFFLLHVFHAQGVVPPSHTFSYVNEGDFGYYIVEYDANYRALPVYSSPFQLCFYNTTLSAYTLALHMGTIRSESLRRWVWEANHDNPVGENATFSLGTNGNLVLADADGCVAWQSNTADKDVVGFELLPNGNMVLYNSKGNFVWQSFDSPTDTLLVGQSLHLKGPNKLVSRLSEIENTMGLIAWFWSQRDLHYTIQELEFYLDPNTTARSHISGWRSMGAYELTHSTKNVNYDAWEETFTLFPRDSGEECQLPVRCGNFGLCEDSQCVACPSPNGLMGWSKSCAPPKLTSCKPNDIKYFKLEGVDHFIMKYSRGTGPMKEADCSRKCTSDCKCLGFFFNWAESRCWVVNDLKTLTKVENSTHSAYIKAPFVDQMMSISRFAKCFIFSVIFNKIMSIKIVCHHY